MGVSGTSDTAILAAWAAHGVVTLWGQSSTKSAPVHAALQIANLVEPLSVGSHSISRLPSGAPRLTSSTELHVSWSRAPGLWAATLGACPVGVDIERTRLRPMSLGLHARVFCSSVELELLGSCHAREHEDVLLTIWSLKEAICKARGHGVASVFREWTVWPPSRSSAPGISATHTSYIAGRAVLNIALGRVLPP